MRCFVVIFGSGAVLVASSHKSTTNPVLVKQLKSNGVGRMILMQAPIELCRARYGEHFEDIERRLGKDEFRVVDFNGCSVFDKFSFAELGQPILVEL
ncbi:putative cytoplasmic protein [Desulfarculus baarsii DSM 2075]|uniref:Cytoplasmic protein n=1 Tax=Desulfarculus baarsii (strain ATCC 33931 / DSM 2075 / LMG 7858 / VKM B-1802 / 2st14) TaxID=644282 RepID=E1QH10_DESB2|nr:hypothetical protein [Desulfarculus baarsii]ADK84853.1 putative cytoplasmic protein [Desulfarculus baarsii DSM 2075]